ncbi:hypothetical protein F4804DRAFT_354324 [Jackrogersella minutella]|nr:hypothetical protein F4804DRAFT_354324 [Jackrogersella minutella]
MVNSNINTTKNMTGDQTRNRKNPGDSVGIDLLKFTSASFGQNVSTAVPEFPPVRPVPATDSPRPLKLGPFGQRQTGLIPCEQDMNQPGRRPNPCPSLPRPSHPIPGQGGTSITSSTQAVNQVIKKGPSLSFPNKAPQAPLPTEASSSLPYGLDQIEAENRKMSTEADRVEIENREKLEKERQRLASRVDWPGDTSAYTAEAMRNLKLPLSEFRAQAIHVGTPKNREPDAIGVYAIYKGRGQDIEFREAHDGLFMSAVRRGPVVRFEQIRLNHYFRDTEQKKVEL